jgi:hypothetical protein
MGDDGPSLRRFHVILPARGAARTASETPSKGTFRLDPQATYA